MRMRVALGASVLLVSGACAGSRAARPDDATLPFRASPAAQRMGTEGWWVVAERTLFGEEAVAAVEGRLGQGALPEELRLSLYEAKEGSWAEVARSPAIPANELPLFHVLDCEGTPNAIAIFREVTPDELTDRVVAVRPGESQDVVDIRLSPAPEQRPHAVVEEGVRVVVSPSEELTIACDGDRLRPVQGRIRSASGTKR